MEWFGDFRAVMYGIYGFLCILCRYFALCIFYVYIIISNECYLLGK